MNGDLAHQGEFPPFWNKVKITIYKVVGVTSRNKNDSMNV